MKEENNYVKWRNSNQLYERIIDVNVTFENRFAIRCESENLLNQCDAFCKRIQNHDQTSWWRELRTHLNTNLLYIFENVSKHYYKTFMNDES